MDDVKAMQKCFTAEMLKQMQMCEIICILGPEASRTHVALIRDCGDTWSLGHSSSGRAYVRHTYLVHTVAKSVFASGIRFFEAEFS